MNINRVERSFVPQALEGLRTRVPQPRTWNAASRWGGLAEAILGRSDSATAAAPADPLGDLVRLYQTGTDAHRTARDLSLRAQRIAQTAREHPYKETFLNERARTPDTPSSKLSPMTRADFEQRMSTLGVDLSQNTPSGRLLQGMRSRSTGKPDPLQRESYAAMVRIASERGPEKFQRMAGTLDGYLRRPNSSMEVVTDGLHDVAIPAGIRQGSVGDCGAVAVQQLWASQHPDTYLQALTSLASGRPHRFADGRQLAPFHNEVPSDRQGRSASGVIMADAIARYSHQNVGRQAIQRGAHSVLDLARWARDEAARRSHALSPTLGGLVKRGLDRVEIPGENGAPIYTIDNYDNKTQSGAANAPGELANVLYDITGRRYRFETGSISGAAAGEVSQGRPAIMLLPGKEFHWVSATGYNYDNHQVQISSWGSQYRAESGQLDDLAVGVLVPEGADSRVSGRGFRDVNIGRRR